MTPVAAADSCHRDRTYCRAARSRRNVSPTRSGILPTLVDEAATGGNCPTLVGKTMTTPPTPSAGPVLVGHMP